MTTTQQFCDDYKSNAKYADAHKYDVWFGEWSLATDVCAMWLGGFNDANNDPQMKCNWVDCPKSYLPDSVARDFDRSAAILGPFGTHTPETDVCVQKGKCSTDSMYFNQDQVRTIAKCALEAFDEHLGASFLWNAKNELEPKWSYIDSWDMAWTNKTAVPADQILDYARYFDKPEPEALTFM